jgi:hypothetical protein
MTTKAAISKAYGGLSPKVVISRTYGGFNLSSAADDRLRELGVANPSDVARHDPRLVQVVEELGRAAHYSGHPLGIEVLCGSLYRITECDGWERVEGPHTIDWIDVTVPS